MTMLWYFNFTAMKEHIVIEAMLADDRAFLKKCLLLLWKKQTEFEQQEHITHETNHVGFNKPDSPVLSGYAVILSDSHSKSLSEHGWRDAEERMMKYSKQLLSLLKEEL